MFHRGEPYFYAFDLLWKDGMDLRDLPLVKRKAKLRKLIPRKASSVLYLDHISGKGVELFEQGHGHAYTRFLEDRVSPSGA